MQVLRQIRPVPRLASPCAEAIRLLRTLTLYRTAREKARVLLQTLEVVVKCAQRALDLATSGTGATEWPSVLLGAEDLLPLVVYVLVRSGVERLPAELAFVADFLPQSMQFGKEGYALTTLQCANHVACELPYDRLGLDANVL